jgi:DNA-binding transcriptional LysR family regulator
MNLLAALDALLDECNVTRAAARLGVTQPTMSGMLQRLRYQLDDELLVRNGRGMELTHYGKGLVTPVRRALLSVESLLKAEPKFDPAISERTFRIMTSDYCTAVYMPRLVERLAKVAPGIQLVIEPLNSPLEKLMSAEIDLCISADGGVPFAEDDQTGLQSKYLFSDKFVCIVGEGHPLDSGLTSKDFFAFPHIGVQMPGVKSTIELAAIRQYEPSYEPTYMVADFSLVASMVAQTNIVGLVQKRLAEQAVRSLPVRYFAPPIDIPGVDEELRWHPRYLGDPGHKWLREVISEIAVEFTEEAEPHSKKRAGASASLEKSDLEDVCTVHTEKAPLGPGHPLLPIASKPQSPKRPSLCNGDLSKQGRASVLQ